MKREPADRQLAFVRLWSCSRSFAIFSRVKVRERVGVRVRIRVRVRVRVRVSLG
jgi:hypothetical protein